ncbi:MAG: ATP-dependent DNA helicase RecG, partial [Faecalibacterium sp.]|nr:ATP-dependent DNA helicase RecG [Faecalibacterium sp.]
MEKHPKADKPLEERLIGVQRTLTAGTPVQYLKGVGPKTAEKFEKLGIFTLADLLCHYPRKYVDFSTCYTPSAAPLYTECVVKAEVFAKLGKRRITGGRSLDRITAGDGSASLEISWFNNPYATEKLQPGQTYYFQGEVSGTLLRKQMINPVVRTEAQVTDTPLLAVYPQTEGLGSGQIGKCIAQALGHAELLEEPLPADML